MLKGEKVVLTELRAPDSEPLHRWINDADVVRFNSAYAPVHAPSHEAWFRAVTADPSRVIFAIRRTPDGPAIGTVQLTALSAVHRSAELIIRIGDEGDRGAGLGSDAVRCAVRFAFRDRGLQRVWLRVFADNTRAVRAYEKAGFVQEGRMRRAGYIDGRWVDELVMAVLSDSP